MDGSFPPQRRKSLTRPGASGPPTQTVESPKRQLEQLVGWSISIKTMSNELVQGRLYTLDRITNCIALICSDPKPVPKSVSFRIIKLSNIKELLSVGPEDTSKEPWTAVSPVRHVHLDQLQARETEALREVRQQAAKIGVGVTKEGQEIFDALYKTLPCRWASDTIVVMDEVLISPPYTIEHCKANASSAASLARVKKVLEGERRRLANPKN
ncbi:anticodon-binding domain-containing protein [Phycomyces blakesleeanus]|uniref:AD domain-containing protein n=2 Tax=Phycomyces blakesleeanus TaxID=4837 RepID=A0A162WBR8_PHYB8|nr:hypothetical protein PHYBLDRAFT_183940 [Phycomyces blakesleeanus NRRL 1555(-)]OAD66125.1 hypothetical protein PHYBLDRAFT_183940 [Phycomyces blakesleeanus NRRL 1555(-)]|eukprot:XP_018284165.1 hypothetical protein PHYBLDRAFT_183940 [Phycomyces blakesleeanus NRRL 1555(-)]